MSETTPTYTADQPAADRCNECGEVLFPLHPYAKCYGCVNRIVRLANGTASPADLAAHVGYTALKLAASLAEFGDDVSASGEWIEALGGAEYALDQALGLADDQIPDAPYDIAVLQQPASRDDQRGREIIAAGNAMAEVCLAHAEVIRTLAAAKTLRAAVERWEAATGAVAGEVDR